jgi:hypothetical protein
MLGGLYFKSVQHILMINCQFTLKNKGMNNQGQSKVKSAFFASKAASALLSDKVKQTLANLLNHLNNRKEMGSGLPFCIR